MARVPALSTMSEEHEDSCYVPVASLAETIFLNPKSPNKCVSEAVNTSFQKKWQCIWLVIDKNSNIIDGVHGPSNMKIKGIKIGEVHANAECVWFFIGPTQAVSKIKTEYNQNKTLNITKEELYWIIYGPAE